MHYLNTLLLVDAHKTTLAGLKYLLRSRARKILDLCSASEALLVAREEKPDFIITDFRLKTETAEELIRDVRYHSPNTRVLVHALSPAQTAIAKAIDAGAHGFISKGDEPTQIQEAIDALAAGKSYYNDAARSYLAQILNNGENHYRVEVIGGVPFNDKEIRIIKLLTEELSAKEIAKRIFLSESSVEQYKIKIARKMGVRNTIGILTFAFKHGMINQDDL